MLTRRTVLVACGVAVIALATAAGSYARTPSRLMLMSFSRPVSLPGVTLPAGSYVFERVADDIHLVRVSSVDKRIVYLTQFTQLVTRPSTLSSTQHIMLGEAGPGTAPPIRAWFPDGERQGHQFVYGAR